MSAPSLDEEEESTEKTKTISSNIFGILLFICCFFIAIQIQPHIFLH